MSVSITTQPNTLNTVYTKLIYNITSTNINLPQYKFVCDIEDVDGNLISRLKQPANSQNIAVFDVSVPLRPKLTFDRTLYIEDPIASAGSQSFDNGIDSYKQFSIKFGEEYGTSPSSSVTLYDGNGGVGDPAVSNYNLSLGRMTWEPWNEANFVPTTGSQSGSQGSGTGSLNYYVAELAGANYVDVNLRVDNAYPAGGFGGSGSLAWSGSSQTYKLDIVSFGVSSSDYRYSMEIYDMSDNQMVYQSSQGTTLPSGYVSGSVGGPTVLDTYNFTGDVNKVYGLRMNGIPTSSFNAPLFEGYYIANNFTASSDSIRSITYPLAVDNIVNLGGFPDTRYWGMTINSTSGSIVGTVDRVFPTVQDLANFIDPGLPVQQTGSFAGWNYNVNSGQTNWKGRVFMTNDPSNIPYETDITTNNFSTSYVGKNLQSFKGISKNDYGTLSFLNVGDYPNEVNVIPRRLLTNDSLLTQDTASWDGQKGPGWTGTLDANFQFAGSGVNTFENIAFGTIPAAMKNIENVATASISEPPTLLQVEAVRNAVRYGIAIYRFDEPCEYENRSNIEFINAYGVWDFIGMNTPTNKNAVITERNEYLKPAADYNSNGAYSVYNRGFEQYFLSQNYRYQITSDPIIDRLSTINGQYSTADYYSELIYSPNVMLQVGTTFVPINITNSSFRYRTNIKSQKVFQVTIQYEMSNKPRSRT